MAVRNNVASHIITKHISLSIPSICNRDPGHASTSYDSPHFARRTSGVSFTSRRSDPGGYSPSYSQDRYADRYDDTSSFDSRQGNSLAADDESTDEGELRPVNRFVYHLYCRPWKTSQWLGGQSHAELHLLHIMHLWVGTQASIMRTKQSVPWRAPILVDLAQFKQVGGQLACQSTEWHALCCICLYVDS